MVGGEQMRGKIGEEVGLHTQTCVDATQMPYRMFGEKGEIETQ